MAIQGTQVPMYTNTYCSCIFLIFQFFLIYFFFKLSVGFFINLIADMAFKNAKYNFFIIILLVTSANSAFYLPRIHFLLQG